jgi:hypothetical protein
LEQLSNSIGIAALLVWMFSFIKNKKTMALVWGHGLQWLYLLSTLGWNNFPHNTLRFLTGFRYTFLIFTTAQPLSNFMDVKLLWASLITLRA